MNQDPKATGWSFIYDDEGNLQHPLVFDKSGIREKVRSVRENLPDDGKIPVISNERLSGNPHSSGFDAGMIADRIHSALPDTKVLIVIREQKSMILSLYFQYLKRGGSDRVIKYISRKYDGMRPGFSLKHLEYTHLVSYYYHLFSRENVLVLPYELFRADPDEFVNQIGRFVSSDIVLEKKDAENISNKRKEYLLLALFPFLNQFRSTSSVNGHSPFYIPYFDKIVSFMDMPVKRYSRIYAEKIRLRIENYIHTRYEKNNKQLSELTGIDLSVYGYHDR